MKKKAAIIGFGGMGKRYYKALKSMGIEVVAICDQNINKIEGIKNKNLIRANNYKKLLNLDFDIVCIASNTKSRFQILKDFVTKSKVKNILIEKPLATSYKKCLEIYKLCNKTKKKKVYVNTFRTLSKNFNNIKKYFKLKKEKITHIFINSPSAGLGNMGSIFFDLSNYFIEDKPLSVNCYLDKTGTVSPRGKQFKDPGGYGIIKYKNNKKVFFDLSENTSLPYKIILKSQNIECVIDELNNKYSIEERPKKLRNKPNYFYLYKPNYKRIKPSHKYDTVLMTKFSIKKLLKSPKFSSNVLQSIRAMELVFACHASKNNKLINLPLRYKLSNRNVNFP